MKIVITLVLALVIATTALPLSQTEAATNCMAFHIVERGDTLSKISRTFNVSLRELITWNNLSNPNLIKVGQHICVRASVIIDDTTNRTHTVQAGNTLYSIARLYGVDMTVLARVNGITNPNRIYVGQVLRIPDVTIQ
jgi:LysM repeat protein